MADKVLMHYAGASIRITAAGDIVLTAAPGRTIRTVGRTRLNNGTRAIAFRGATTTRGDAIADGESEVLV